MKHIFKRIFVLSLVFSPAILQAVHAEGNASEQAQLGSATIPMSDGEIKKINRETGKLTIKHGELKNLNMPPMTMVFRVQDPAMLDQVKVGDKIQFVPQKMDGQFTVMHLEVMPAN